MNELVATLLLQLAYIALWVIAFMAVGLALLFLLALWAGRALRAADEDVPDLPDYDGGYDGGETRR